MSWELTDDEDVLMLDEHCDKCGFLLHVLRGGERLCIPTT